MPSRLAFDRPVSDETYLELVRSLAGTLLNTALFGLLFSAVVCLAAMDAADPVLLGCGGAGVALALVRVVLLLRLRRRVASRELTRSRARIEEATYGAAYLTFAGVLGLFAARALQTGHPELQLLATTLVVGFAAGVAAGLSLRPWLGVPAMGLVVVPMVATSLIAGSAHRMLLGIVLAALLAGALVSMLARYRSAIEKIAMRQLLGTLARQDHLTGLANRLSLSEAYAGQAAARPCDTVAVHCLDLDGFKQVNDRHGHAVGDALLQQVGERLQAMIRKSDVAARLGGDEFVILQAGVGHPGEAELMVRRMVRALGEPYTIDGRRLTVGVSVGYALADNAGSDLARLLECADAALYKVKRQGGGGAATAAVERPGTVVRLAG